ncbi:hypothetical protein ACDA63_11100 [Uliginosibacterium sp. sgz301328]|uniref:rhamnogalacturonan lyase family protein n=1 Tax=Uliginosibacterium sp. sgz301328 TaxID=3243764 RepID=UPI00359D2E49
METTVMQESFNEFAIGPFPFDPKHSAIGEYHYYPTQGFKGRWYDPVVWWGWLGPTWIVTEDGGRKFMEQTRPQMAITDHWPLLVTGQTNWRDYTLSASVRPMSTAAPVGVVFRYTHARHHYFFGFEGRRAVIAKRDQEAFIELAAADFPHDTDTHYRLSVECAGELIRASIDGVPLLEVRDASYADGKVGLTARMPAQYTDVTVTMTPAQHAEWIERDAIDTLMLAGMRAQYPQPRLWKTLDLKNFGSARQIRFGHLTGTDELFVVFAQHQKRGYKDAYAHISCLTAMDLDGKVLWQIGEPSTEPDHVLLSADLPVQLCDIDGDGVDEVIMSRDFKLMILDGRTGEVRKSVPTPKSEQADNTLHSLPYKKYAFDRVNVDAIRMADLRGVGRPTDILIKDRYSRVWAYDSELNPLWFFHEGITGHFPYTADIDGDGKEEMFVGYHMVDDDGRLMWTLPVPTDHTDEILIGRWNPDVAEPQIAIASGDEGFMIANLQGEIVKKHMLGHVQRVSVGNYRPDLKGLELCVVTYWGYQGIVYVFDCKGELLHEFEPTSNGNLLTPVNWTGDGRDLVLLNGNVTHGGLMDGEGRVVVRFPDDGHPDLCAEVIDLTGDGRDEIVLWDAQRMYIYTQDRAADADPVYKPLKYPLCNASNYRGEFHYPPQGI